MDEGHSVKIKKWLYPASFLYGIGVNMRNKLFDWNILRSKSFNIPVICIGNLAVGGTGKTPHIEYLIRLLQDEFQVAVLSRGYKRGSKGYILAASESGASAIGDESYQIKNKFPNVCVAVDKNRRHGIEELCRLNKPNVDVVLLDDAYQHRYVQAGIDILLTDYNCLFCNDALLPAGSLREPARGKNRAHIVIVTKCPEYIKPIDYNIIIKRLGLYPYQKLYFSTLEYGDLTPVFPGVGNGKMKPERLEADCKVLLVTGIASPVKIIEEIQKYTREIDVLTFGDHHRFSEKDLQQIRQRFERLGGEKKIIITTEKDAARLVCHPKLSEELKEHIYALPVYVKMLKNRQNTFDQHIINYVRKNKRNSLVP